VANKITKDDLNIRAERRAMFFFACYGLECAFKQLPSNIRVLDPKCLAMITKSATLDRLRTSDPFYTKVFAEARQLTDARPPPEAVFANIELKSSVKQDENKIHLDTSLIDGIWKWYNLGENKELREAIDKSVKQDRIDQKAEIDRRISMYKKQITE